MKKSLITYGVIFLIVLVVSLLMTPRSGIKAEGGFPFSGAVWYMLTDSCTPDTYWLYAKAVRDSPPGWNSGWGWMPNNCGYNQHANGAGKYSLWAKHEVDGEQVTQGIVRNVYYDGEHYVHQDIRVYDFSSGPDP